MITLTPIAISKVKEIIAARDASLGLRIAVIGGGCSGFQYQMTLDKQLDEDDESIDFEGLRVLVDAQSMIFMDGTTIDFVEAKDGSGFTFDNPNAQNGCSSCGGGCSTDQ
jgi:iron-sulfur cluster assembly protein